ncbi:MAG TPA: hypothetical protein VHC48_00420 [Puia sp.]|nr:hypothetical protein [Puia sp.]
MKLLLYTTLLVAGTAGNVFVFGQTCGEERRTSGILPSLLPQKDSVWIMGPDRMPCLVPSPAATERMPVKKLDSRLVRPMPNGMTNKGPWVRPAPKKRE